MASDLQCTNVQGVLVDGNKYFWLNSQAYLGVELYARALAITWHSNSEYWTYSFEKIPNTDYTVEVAHLKKVCWLDVKGEFDMRKLTVGAKYEILFDIELTSEARGGWWSPVTFEHKNPFGLTNKFEMKLDTLIGKGRTQIPIGTFTLPCFPVEAPNATFHMYEHDDTWKNGLIMHGVVIMPMVTN